MAESGYENEIASRVVGFRQEKRALPWRTEVRDPYLTLVSEIMLQQTQVERVVARFEAFVARFPSLRSLACAAEDEVLSMWSGLGYYRRARLLHRLAKRVNAEMDGVLPVSAAELEELPGIGAYTAAAVASMVHGEAEPVMDGNVRRVAARRWVITGDPRSAASTATIDAWIRGLMGTQDPGEVNEALMELGARICTPKKPRCSACPVAGECRALAAGLVAELPKPRQTKKIEHLRWISACCVAEDGRWLLKRVEEGPILRGLWLPPVGVLAEGGLPLEEARRLATVKVGQGVLLPSVKHSITHRRIEVIPVRFDLCTDETPAASWQIVRPRELRGGTSSLLSKLVKVVS